MASENNAIGERIKNRRKELGLSAEKVAEIMGVSPATIYRYESKDIMNMGIDKIIPIAKALHISPSYLMGWDEHPDKKLFDIADIRPLPQFYEVPRLGKIACGTPALAVENHDDYDLVPIDVKCDFTLMCKGDSMINARIFDGDIVYIRKQEDVDDGEIAAVLIEDEATLKRVRKYPDHIVLAPENPTVQPLVYWHEEMNNIRIIGKAIAFTSNIR